MAKQYKNLEGAKRGMAKIIKEYPSWLKMQDKLWIVKNREGSYTLQDYSPIHIQSNLNIVDLKNRIIDMTKYKIV